jgi:phosphoglycolate phosphatase
MPRYQHIIFDLDGTLIDSAPAILASFRAAFAAAGLAPARAIEAEIIGPPLRETLALISGSQDPELLADLAARFAAIYDTTGLLATRAYAGVDAMLRELAGARLALSIATNKRILPTRKILEHLGWSALFRHVYALDLFEPRLPDKAAMLGRLLADQGIARLQAIYVGDREEDGLAAQGNELPFLAATWGYGSLSPAELRPGWGLLARPADLPAALAQEKGPP